MAKTYFFWDPLSDNILQERDDAGVVAAEYTTEPGLYGNLISQNRGGVESQYHFDAAGSTLALSNDNQQITDTYAYTAFGEESERTGNTVNPFQYIGNKGYHKATSLQEYFIRRRAMMPLIARWLSADPVSNIASLNLYLFCANAPLIHIDPSGLFPVCRLASFEFPAVVDGCRIQKPTKGNEGVGTWLGIYFSVKAEFLEPCCECCEYRQYVMSYCRYRAWNNVRWSEWTKCSKTDKSEWHEDGFPNPAYGHRGGGENHETDAYYPVRGNGCTFQASDFPGIQIDVFLQTLKDFPKLVQKYEFDVLHWFYGVIVNTCVGPLEPSFPGSEYGIRCAIASVHFRCRGVVLATGEFETGSPTQNYRSQSPPGNVDRGNSPYCQSQQ